MATLESSRDGARVVFGITGISGDDDEEEDSLLVKLTPYTHVHESQKTRHSYPNCTCLILGFVECFVPAWTIGPLFL